MLVLGLLFSALALPQVDRQAASLPGSPLQAGPPQALFACGILVFDGTLEHAIDEAERSVLVKYSTIHAKQDEPAKRHAGKFWMQALDASAKARE